MLLGRGQECARLDGLLAAAREDRSGALVIRGEAGVGKTALLRYALESAPDMTVLEVDGVESESELAFAGLADLLRPVLDRLERIPPPQAEALRGALALAPAAPGDPFAVSAGTLSLLSTAAESRPLLALVDDAHWLDASSAAVMAFAARRLGREGVVLLFAMRAEERGAIDLSGIPELRLAGLGRAESEALLVAAGAGTIAPDVAAALHEATGGNPLALLELPALLSEAQLEGVEPLGYPVPAGEGVQRSFLGRVRRMPPETRRALTVAAASEDGDIDAIARAAAELGTDAASLEPAESAGLIRLARGRLAWRHPLLRAAIYQDADAAERRAAHRALAHALVGNNRAWHLAAGALAPEESVAQALEEAAQAARARNAYAAAGSAFERAARLTPDAERSARRLLEAGRDFQLVGRSAHALDLLDQALPSATDPLLRAEIHHARGALEMWGAGPVRAQEHLVGEAERIVELDPAQAAMMLADAAILCTMTGDCRAALATSRRAESIAPRTGEPLRDVTEALLSNSLILCGQARAASPSLRRLRRRWHETDPLASPPLVHAIGHGSLWIEDFAEAGSVLERAIEAARAASAGALLSFPLAMLAELNFRIGRWAEAYSEASESAQVAAETQQLSQSSFALVCLAEVEAARGLEDDCRAHARRRRHRRGHGRAVHRHLLRPRARVARAWPGTPGRGDRGAGAARRAHRGARARGAGGRLVDRRPGRGLHPGRPAPRRRAPARATGAPSRQHGADVGARDGRPLPWTPGGQARLRPSLR